MKLPKLSFPIYGLDNFGIFLSNPDNSLSCFLKLYWRAQAPSLSGEAYASPSIISRKEGLA